VLGKKEIEAEEAAHVRRASQGQGLARSAADEPNQASATAGAASMHSAWWWPSRTHPRGRNRAWCPLLAQSRTRIVGSIRR
jgi:hypothetical protein